MFGNEKIKNVLAYLFCAVFVAVLVILVVKNVGMSEFFNSIENKTFDIRQKILVSSNYKKVDKDIVLITVDDASYEYLVERYGEWPISRSVYADLINYVEAQNPKALAFDLMFIKSMKSKTNDDARLVKALKSYDNVFTSMNLDNQSEEVRKAVDLDKKFSVNVENKSSIDFVKEAGFSNCRAILPQILENTSNVGMINVSRSNDGVLRKLPLFMVYRNQYYPHLAMMVAQKAIGDNTKDFLVSSNKTVKFANRNIPVDKDGGVILNWYGAAGSTFTEVPLYKVVKAMYGDKTQKLDFSNKIVYVGTTAVSLFDTKTVPVDKVYPGVEIHTTFINNFINNEFIKRVDVSVDIVVSLILALVVGFAVYKSPTVIISLSQVLIAILGYVIVSYFMMKYCNLWLAIVVPVLAVVVTFVAVYIFKFIVKSRDFEHQYKLATTDGLTELYNHRYFQEQMIAQIANSKRYNLNFSMIMSDIDFFKKFNDVHGHQSGDAVLKQVAAKLKKNVRSSDFVCRYGGEEMTIILPNTDYEEAVHTAEKLCALIAEKPFKLANNKESNVTVSLGVSTYPQDGEDAATIIAAADKRLYNAKENGRNQVGK